MIQLLEILKTLESKYCKLVNSTSCHTSNSCLKFCGDFLENALLGLSSGNEINISFIVKQIRLCIIDNSRNCRYSQALLGMASMWNSTSSSLYKQILSEGC